MKWKRPGDADEKEESDKSPPSKYHDPNMRQTKFSLTRSNMFFQIDDIPKPPIKKRESAPLKPP